MISVEFELVTAANLEVNIITDKDYDKISLYMSSNDSNIELDYCLNNVSKNNILIHKGDNKYEIDVNMIQFDFIYYKDFYFEIKKDDELVDTSEVFKIEPKGRKDLYGIVNKLKISFEKLWLISGTECALIVENPVAQKCSKCWDEELGQRISSECTECDGTGETTEYIPIYFKGRKVKNNTQQVVTDKGIRIYNIAVYTTFDRLNFILGSIIFDITTREFFEVKNALAASIGGVRTSTRITAQQIPSNDARVTKLLKIVK